MASNIQETIQERFAERNFALKPHIFSASDGRGRQFRQEPGLVLASRADRDRSMSPTDNLTNLIIASVSKVFEVDEDAIKGASRTYTVVDARHAAFYLLRTKTNISYPTIAELFEKDHTSIMHGDQRVSEALEKGATTTRAVNLVGAVTRAEEVIVNALEAIAVQAEDGSTELFVPDLVTVNADGLYGYRAQSIEEVQANLFDVPLFTPVHDTDSRQAPEGLLQEYGALALELLMPR